MLFLYFYDAKCLFFLLAEAVQSMLKSCIAQASRSLGPVPHYGEGGTQHSSKTPGRSEKIKQIFLEKIFNLMPANYLLAFNLGNSLICFQILANIIRRYGNRKSKNHVKHYDVIFRVNNQKLFTINNIELSEVITRENVYKFFPMNLGKFSGVNDVRVLNSVKFMSLK